jgi:hypothetical protein
MGRIKVEKCDSPPNKNTTCPTTHAKQRRTTAGWSAATNARWPSSGLGRRSDERRRPTLASGPLLQHFCTSPFLQVQRAYPRAWSSALATAAPAADSSRRVRRRLRRAHGNDQASHRVAQDAGAERGKRWPRSAPVLVRPLFSELMRDVLQVKAEPACAARHRDRDHRRRYAFEPRPDYGKC